MGSIQRRVEDIWGREGDSLSLPDRALCIILRAASVGWRLGAGVRSAAYGYGWKAQRRVGCPVVSIGNLTVGGTGKTPFVMEAARLLRENGERPAIVSRGYRRAGGDAVTVVSDGRGILSDAAHAGDEPLMMARRMSDVPVVVGASRYDAAEVARRKCGADVVVLDDGFQHRALARDCDIVLWDALRPLGSMRMMPRGPMREGLSALRRADALVFTRCNLGRSTRKALARIKRVAPGLVVFHTDLVAEALLPLRGATDALSAEALKGQRVAAFCGLGNPASFWRLLEASGAHLAAWHSFPDHHKPSAEELRSFEGQALQARADWLLLTEKDAENLPGDWKPSVPTYCVRVGIGWGGEEERLRFRDFLMSRVSRQ